MRCVRLFREPSYQARFFQSHMVDACLYFVFEIKYEGTHSCDFNDWLMTLEHSDSSQFVSESVGIRF